MIERIIIAGAGGQGVMLLGKILAEAAMRENKFVTWLPSYGSEVRGGTAHCIVVISDEEIGSPYVWAADTLIVMNAPSLIKFKNRIIKKGLLVINSSLIPEYSDKNLNVSKHPFTDIASKIGNIKVANMVVLGSYLARKKVVSLKAIYDTISDIGREAKSKLIEINIKAVEEGVKLK